MRSIPQLTLVPGGRADVGRIGDVSVTVAEPGDPAIRGATVVYEEDTHLVLSAPPILPAVRGDPIRILEDVRVTEPCHVGTIVARPRELLAIVHDLSAVPTTRDEWIRPTIVRALAIAEERRLPRLVFQPLGAVHGRVSTAAAVTRILAAVAERSLAHLRSVAIVVDPADRVEAEAALGRWLARVEGR